MPQGGENALSPVILEVGHAINSNRFTAVES